MLYNKIDLLVGEKLEKYIKDSNSDHSKKFIDDINDKKTWYAYLNDKNKYVVRINIYESKDIPNVYEGYIASNEENHNINLDELIREFKKVINLKKEIQLTIINKEILNNISFNKLENIEILEYYYATQNFDIRIGNLEEKEILIDDIIIKYLEADTSIKIDLTMINNVTNELISSLITIFNNKEMYLVLPIKLEEKNFNLTALTIKIQ